MIKSIVISGPPAVGKTTVAQGLAKEFDLKYLGGGDILKQLAREQGFSAEGDDWWDTKEGMRFLSQRQTDPQFDKKVDEKLKSLFEKGNVIITSYTLPWLVKNGVKIWLKGSFENSAKRMQSRDNLPHDKAMQIVKQRYDENKKLYKKLYDIDFGENLSVFDKVIDTDGLEAAQVIDIAKQVVKEKL